VELGDLSTEYGLVALVGPDARHMLDVLRLPAPEELWSHRVADGGARVVRMRLAAAPGWGILGRHDALAAPWARAVDAGATPVGVEALNVARIEAGIPWYGQDASEETFPLEVNLGDTISTTKGCYLGQETIVRILHRGHLNRRLFGLVLEATEPPPEGSEVTREGAAIGTLTSAAHSPGMGRAIGLALLRLRAAAPGMTVEIVAPGGAVRAVVTELPFTVGSAA